MHDKMLEIHMPETPAADEVADAEVLDQVLPDRKETAALVAEMLAAVLAVVADGAAPNRLKSKTIARDRVLVPEIRVGHVLDAVESLRPRLLGAAAGMCGAGADRLKSVQGAIRSKIESQS